MILHYLLRFIRPIINSANTDYFITIRSHHMKDCRCITSFDSL